MSTPQALRRATDEGFTLVELLVSMVLFGLLAVALNAGVQFGSRVWGKVESGTLEDNKLRAAQVLIADRLSRAYPLVVADGHVEPHVSFIGRASSMSFLAPDDLNGGFQRVTFRFEPGVKGGSLLYEESPELATGSVSNQHVLLSGVTNVEFGYQAAAQNQSMSWRDVWENRMRLPVLVRIRARFSKHPNDWTELLVRTRVAASASCVFDPETKFCQGY